MASSSHLMARLLEDSLGDRLVTWPLQRWECNLWLLAQSHATNGNIKVARKGQKLQPGDQNRYIHNTTLLSAHVTSCGLTPEGTRTFGFVKELPGGGGGIQCFQEMRCIEVAQTILEHQWRRTDPPRNAVWGWWWWGGGITTTHCKPTSHAGRSCNHFRILQ